MKSSVPINCTSLEKIEGSNNVRLHGLLNDNPFYVTISPYTHDAVPRIAGQLTIDSDGKGTVTINDIVCIVNPDALPHTVISNSSDVIVFMFGGSNLAYAITDDECDTATFNGTQNGTPFQLVKEGTTRLTCSPIKD